MRPRIAGLLITTEAMVAELPKDKSAAPAMLGGRHGRHGFLIPNPSNEPEGPRNADPFLFKPALNYLDNE